MPGIFISYRREDSGGYAGRLFDLLSAHFGNDRVFMDLTGIRGGDDFANVIESSVGNCDTLLAIIGDHWTTLKGADGLRRLDEPNDFVRLEIAEALERGIRVIPVLVCKATVPDANDLPEALRPLVAHQAVDVRDSHFHEDAGELIAVLDAIVNPARRKSQPRLSPTTVIAGSLAIVALIAGTVVYMHRAQANHTSAAVPPPAIASPAALGSPAGAGASQPGTPAGSVVSTPSTAPAADVAGVWHATVTYDWANAVYNEVFRFQVDGSELSGSASLLTAPHGFMDGKIAGKEISFTTKSSTTMGDEDKVYEDLHHYKGTVEGNTIRFSLLTESQASPHDIVYFTATRAGAK